MSTRFPAAASIITMALLSAAAPAQANWPAVLSGNTTGFADSFFLGPPDDVFVGLAEVVLSVPPGAVGTQRFYQVLVLDPGLASGGVFSDALELEFVP